VTLPGARCCTELGRREAPRTLSVAPTIFVTRVALTTMTELLFFAIVVGRFYSVELASLLPCPRHFICAPGLSWFRLCSATAVLNAPPPSRRGEKSPPFRDFVRRVRALEAP
jgi:hypothetical protein